MVIKQVHNMFTNPFSTHLYLLKKFKNCLKDLLSNLAWGRIKIMASNVIG